MELKGKRIIIPPLKEIQRGSSYTADVLSKMKFEDKFEYNELIYGDTLAITDVQHLNVGDKKNEKVLIHLLHNGIPIVFYLPIYFKSDDQRVYRNFYTNLTTDLGVFSVNKIAKIENINLCYYDADLISQINLEWLNHLVYPRETEFAEVYNGRHFATEQMNKFEPYLFLGFKFLNLNNSNGNFEILNAVFSNKNGVKYYLPIQHAHSHENANGHILQDFTDSFYSDIELKTHCENNRNAALIDSIQQLYVGKEVYIDKSKLENSTSERAFNLASRNGSLNNWGDGYFKISEVRMLPSYNNKPFYQYFAIAHNESSEFAIPIDNNFHNIVVDGLTHRAEVEAEASRLKIERMAQEAEWERQEREQKAALSRKYGSANAKLISDGAIRLGFTKAMVREAWGAPYDTMTVSNNYGSVECWIYGLGSYVYFRGNKVIQIID